MAVWIFLILIFPLALFLYMYKEAFRNYVNEITLPYENFPLSDGQLSIFFITDIHRRVIANSIIDRVKGKADVVIIGGDLTEKGVPFKRTKENIEKLKKIGPVFFVWGNNDYEVNPSELQMLLLQCGVQILENRSVPLPYPSKAPLYLTGIGEVSYQLDSVWLALQGVEQEGFNIVVCHNPSIIGKLSEKDNISLLLSGHTHGGQINFFGLSLYPKGRLKRVKHFYCLISNGYGTTMLPLRFWARAETHLIHIIRK